MDEVTGPVIAVALVLCAVFVPCAFISGITGQFFRQFAVTIAVSTIFSMINSLTLSPALAAILLRPHGTRRDPLALAARPAARLVLPALQRRLRGRRPRPTPGWWAGCSAAACLVCWSYGGLLFLTYGSSARPDRVRPGTGPGAADRQRPVARLGLAPAHPGGDGPARADPREHAGRGARDHRRGHVVRAVGQQLELRLDVRDPQPVRAAADPALRDTAIMARLRGEWAPEVKDAQVVAFGAPPIPGPERRGGLQAHGRGPGRPRPADLQRQTEP